VFQVWTCISQEHNLPLVALAAIACILGAVVSLRLHQRAAEFADNRRFGWLFLAGLAFGSTVWTTHFLAMLGYDPAIAHGFEPERTFVSLFIAIFVAMSGFLIASSGRSRLDATIGGGAIGVGIASMHYVGMSGFLVAGTIEWDPALVAASLVFALAFGALALNWNLAPRSRRTMIGTTASLVAAVVALHFTAMGAVTIVPDPTIAVPDQAVSTEILAAAVFAMMTLVVGAGLSTHLIDNKSNAEALAHFRHLALHYPLTCLPNRAKANALREKWANEAAAAGQSLALLVIDLDRFKYVNDVYGHHAGDALLVAIGERLAACLSVDEAVARIGGDEFIALKRFDGDRAALDAFTARIMDAVSRQTQIDGRILSTGCSIGISVLPDHAGDANELGVCADLAMYRAKRRSAEKTCLYEPALDDAMRNRGEIAVALENAIAAGEFDLLYQPQLSVTEDSLTGFEALIRWCRGDGEVVEPAKFIPIAEETGLIIAIGEWVLRRACAEAASWKAPYTVAVNVSPVQIAQPDLPEMVHEALIASGLEPGRLEIEITESVLLDDVTHTLHILRRLKDLGVRIAMDDFGTGYSSLSSLQSFPFDKIKIDRSFVQGVGASEQSNSIIRAIISLAHSLSIPVVAEGVETRSHFEFLREGNCDHIQGYLLSRPISAEKLEGLMDRDFTLGGGPADAVGLLVGAAATA
jgi:diguanylate cyclase (GGDEF)-like protein